MDIDLIASQGLNSATALADHALAAAKRRT